MGGHFVLPHACHCDLYKNGMAYPNQSRPKWIAPSKKSQIPLHIFLQTLLGVEVGGEKKEYSVRTAQSLFTFTSNSLSTLVTSNACNNRRQLVDNPESEIAGETVKTCLSSLNRQAVKQLEPEGIQKQMDLLISVLPR